MNDKLYGVFGLLAGFLIAFLIFGKVPDVETKKEIRTVESKYWKAEYTKLETKYNQYVQKNVEIEKTVTKLYDENGKLKSEVTDYKKKDLSKIDTAKTSTSTTTVTETGKVKEVVKITDKTINYVGSFGLGIDPFNTSNFCGSVQYDIFKPIFLEAIPHYNIISSEKGVYILVGMRF